MVDSVDWYDKIPPLKFLCEAVKADGRDQIDYEIFRSIARIAREWGSFVAAAINSSDEEHLLKEIFRLFKGKSKCIGRNEAISADDLVAKVKDQEAGILDLVWLGERSAAHTFLNRKYRVTIINKATDLFRAGVPGNKIGQYFTWDKPKDLRVVQKTCAVKDDWDSGHVSLDEVFASKIQVIYTWNAQGGVVAYEGTAAPLDTFMDVDDLAKKAFNGMGHQVMIVCPWDIAETKLRFQKDEPLERGAPWQLLEYNPSQLCQDAFFGKLDESFNKTPEEVDEKGKFGLAPLHYAAMSRELDQRSVQALLRCRADPAIKSEIGLTPLIIAAEVGNAATVRSLLRCGHGDPGEVLAAEPLLGRGPLHFAARHGNTEALTCMLASNAAADATDDAGCTPLWMACRHGHAEAAKALLAVGADASHDLLQHASGGAAATKELVERLLKDPDAWEGGKDCFLRGATPLHAAVMGGHSEVVKVLAGEYGAKACRPATPQAFDLLHTAVAAGNEKLVEALAVYGPRAGVDVNAPRTSSKHGDTALHLAVTRGNAKCIRALLAPGSAVRANVPDFSGWTPLHLAVCRGAAALEAIVALLEAAAAAGKGKAGDAAAAGGDEPAPFEAVIDARLANGTTPLILTAALGPGRDETGAVTKALLQFKPRLEAADADGYTALYRAAAAGHAEAVKLLARAGARVSAADARGWTALHRAAHCGHVDTVAALLQCKADPAAAVPVPAGGGGPVGFKGGKKTSGEPIYPFDVARGNDVKRLLAEKGGAPSTAKSEFGTESGGASRGLAALSRSVASA